MDKIAEQETDVCMVVVSMFCFFYKFDSQQLKIYVSD